MNSSLPRQRPKRANEEFMRHDYAEGSERSNKKARFDYRNPSTLAPDIQDEDPILELDEIGRGGQVKRNAVELDGYDSDSDNDNFDQRARQRAQEQGREKKGGKSQAEEENDMFADLEEEVDGGGDEDEDVLKEGKKNKEVKFMEQADIEGQVASSKSGGHVSADFTLGKGKSVRDKEQESSSEDEVDEDERGRTGEGEDEEEMGAGAKKKHAPKLDAFNMKNEAEEGKFDESGNFIRNAADPFAVHDSWLEGSSKTEMKKAQEAHDKREEERRQRDIADDAVSTGEILDSLISLLEDDETVLEALGRLGGAREKKKPRWQKNKRKNGADMDVDDVDDQKEIMRKQAVEAITAAADQLLTRGQTEIYEAEKALLMRQYKRETGDAWINRSAVPEAAERHVSKEWEYRWSDARDGGDSHGPYDGHTMLAWNEAGYFGEGVEFREIGAADWARVVDFI